MDENNNKEKLEEMSGIGEVENMGGGDINNDITPTRVSTNDEKIENVEEPVKRLTPEEPQKGSNTGIIVFIIALVAIVSAAVIFFTAPSKTEKFVKQLTDDYILGGSDGISEYLLLDGTITSDIAIKSKTLASFIGIDVSEIPFERLAFVSKQSKSGFKFSGKVYLDVDNKEIATLKYAFEDETLGVTIPDLMNEYFVVKNENLKDLAQKLGVSGEELEQIPNKISIEEIMELIEDEDAKEEEIEELNRILEKYKTPLENAIENNLSGEKNKDVVINDKTIKTTKHTLALTEKETAQLLIDLLEILKVDKELFDFIIDEFSGDTAYNDFSEWQNDIGEVITEFSTDFESYDDTVNFFELSSYVKGKNTLRIEVYIPSIDFEISVSALNDKKSSYINLSAVTMGEEISLILKSSVEDKKMNGMLSLAMKTESSNVIFDLIEYSSSYSTDNNFETFEPSFILNEKTKEEINAKLAEISASGDEYLSIIINKLPEGLQALVNGMSGDSHDHSHDFDEPFALTGSQVFILEQSNQKYNSINFGMKKEDVVALMGEPTSEEEYLGMTFVEWREEDNYSEAYGVVIEEGVVTEISRSLASDSYENVQLSTEIKTELEDIESKIKGVEEGMTLAEVTYILGDKFIEVSRNVNGGRDYLWYDKAEYNTVVSFDEEGKVWYIDEVWGSY